MRLSELLEYDQHSPSGLRWLVDRGCGGNGAKSGSVAGTLARDRRNGYESWRVKVNGKKLGAHRIVWELVHQVDLPADVEIDHINGDPTDNRAENLRPVSREMNCRNKKVRRTNRVGVSGVYFCPRKGDGSYYASYVDLSGNEHTKHFACRKYGRDAALRMAIQWRLERVAEMNACGAGYTTRQIGDLRPGPWEE